MYPHMLQAIKNKGLLPKVKWDVIIDSSIEGVIKPDPEIFKFGEERSRYKGNDILFVENSSNNLKAAREYGWQVFLYDSTHPEEESRRLSELF